MKKIDKKTSSMILIEAIKLFDLEIVQYLIEKGFRLNDHNRGYDAIKFAIEFNSREMFDLVLNNYDGKEYFTLLRSCIANKNLEFFKDILKIIADGKRCKIDEHFKNSLLTNSIHSGDINILNATYDQLYKNSSDFEKINHVDAQFMSHEILVFLYEHNFRIMKPLKILHYSISDNCIDNIKYLFDKNMVKKDMNDCLKIALEFDSLKSIDYFLKKGADSSYILKYGSEDVLKRFKQQELKKLHINLHKQIPIKGSLAKKVKI